MKLLNERDLNVAVQLARDAQQDRHDYITFEVEPRGHVLKWMNLWEGCLGEVIGRTYYEDENFNPDIPSARTVKHIIIRARVIDIINAGLRASKRFDRELAQPLRANKLTTSRKPDTQR